MKVAAAVARFLHASGIRRVYGLPGEDHMDLLSALADAGIDYVLARSESAACIMASVDAQVSGLPGVVVVTYAPGLTNAINGIANAYLDQLPLLVISGQHARSRLPLTIRQSMDSFRLVSSITKWSATAGDRVNQLLSRALALATTAPRGPVFLELSQEVAQSECVDDAGRWMPLPKAEESAVPVSADGFGRELSSRLAAAARPVAIVGGDRYDAGMRSLLSRFASRARVPVFTTPTAKGLVGPSDPWFAGTFIAGNLEGRILDRADLIVAINLSGRDVFNRPWPYAAQALVLSDVPDTERFFPRDLELTGRTSALIGAVAEHWSTGKSQWTEGELADYRDHLEAALRTPNPAELSAASAIRVARRTLPEDCAVFVDAGFSKPLLSLLWPSAYPNSYFSSHGLSTMGYAIPAANAAKLVRPERVAVAFTGDGSLLMRASEIGVAAALGLAPIYVAWIDRALTQIAVKQKRLGLQRVGVELPASSCERIAAAFDAWGRDVHTVAEFEEALRIALTCDRPSLIGVHIEGTPPSELFELIRG